MLERLVLKNALDCTSQRLKRTSGARVMTIFSSFTYNWSLSMYLTIGSVLELLVLKNGAKCFSQRLTWTSGAPPWYKNGSLVIIKGIVPVTRF